MIELRNLTKTYGTTTAVDDLTVTPGLDEPSPPPAAAGPAHLRSHSMPDFDTATTVTPTAAPGRYDVRIGPDWQAAGRTNGGYLLALLGRGAVAAVGDAHPHPIAASAHFLHPPQPAPAQVHVEVLRTGRRAAQTRTLAPARADRWAS